MATRISAVDPGWRHAMRYLADSEGGILKKFERDFGWGGEEGPLIEMTERLRLGTVKASADIRFSPLESEKNKDWKTNPDMRVIKAYSHLWVQAYMRDFVGREIRSWSLVGRMYRRQAYAYLDEGNRPAYEASVKSYEEVLKKLRHLTQAYSAFIGFEFRQHFEDACEMVAEGTKGWDKSREAVDATGLQPTSRGVSLGPAAKKSVIPENRKPLYILESSNGDYVYVDAVKGQAISDRNKQHFRLLVGRPGRMVQAKIDLLTRAHRVGNSRTRFLATHIKTSLGELRIPDSKSEKATWKGAAARRLETDNESLIAELGVYSRKSAEPPPPTP